MPKVLALIPARAGSQRAPNKNFAELGGQPLICWTIRAAEEANIFDTIAVSSDSDDICSIAENEGCRVIRRPRELALPESPMLPVVKHTLAQCPADVVMLLQPTSPFRTAEDITTCYDLLIGTKADSVISVTDVPQDLVFEMGHAKRLRHRPDFVTPNGALYAITNSALEHGEDWYSGVCYAYKMPKERSLDIDSQLDLEIARLMVARRRAA